MIFPHGLSSDVLLTAIQEECAELIAAIAKYKRVIDGTNVTPVTQEEASDHINEEVADTLLCIETWLNHTNDYQAINDIKQEKYDRWIRRLNDGQ